MLKQDWLAVPEGKIYPELFRAGTELTGELLDRAKSLGLIEVKSLGSAPENKRRGQRK